jgi:hypothetical protein
MTKTSLILTLLFPWSLFAQTRDSITVSMDRSCLKVISVGSRPDFLVAYGYYAWVIDDGNSQIKKLSVKSNKPMLTIPIPDACANHKYTQKSTGNDL